MKAILTTHCHCSRVIDIPSMRTEIVVPMLEPYTVAAISDPKRPQIRTRTFRFDGMASTSLFGEECVRFKEVV